CARRDRDLAAAPRKRARRRGQHHRHRRPVPRDRARRHGRLPARTGGDLLRRRGSAARRWDLSAVVIVMLAIFFITSADSASLVNSQPSQTGNPAPNRLITAFWALCMAGIAVVILLFGGQNALQGLQNLIVVSALPFAVVLVLMAVALV